MKVINNVKMKNCDQWLAGFVKKILKKAKIKCDKAVVDVFDGKFISITVDEDEDTYKIMIDGCMEQEFDINQILCATKLSWVLFERKKESYMGILTGVYKVTWQNKLEEYFPEGVLKSIALSILERADINTNGAEWQWSEHNSIVIKIDEIDYVINVLCFPVLEINQEGMPISFEIKYLLRKVVYDDKIGHMTDVGVGEVLLEYNESAVDDFYVDCDVYYDVDDPDIINAEDYIWLEVEDEEGIEICLWHSLKSRDRKRVSLGDTVQFEDYVGRLRKGTVLVIGGREGYVHADDICYADHYCEK